VEYVVPNAAASRISIGSLVRSGAAAGVLADFFGEHAHIRVTSDVMPGVVRSFDSSRMPR